MDYKDQVLMHPAAAEYYREYYPHCKCCSKVINRGETYCMTGKPCDVCNEISCDRMREHLCSRCKEPMDNKRRQKTLDNYLGFAVQKGDLDEIKRLLQLGANINMNYNHKNLLVTTYKKEIIDFLVSKGLKEYE